MLFRFRDFGCIQDEILGLRWSPADFAAEIVKRAAVLAAAEVKPRSTVAIAHSGTALFFADLFAAWVLDCAAACLDPILTPNEIQNLVEFVRPSAILVGESSISAPKSVPILNLARAQPSTARIPDSVGNADAPALILFTSGTTGHPKGVVLSFRSVLERIALNRAAMGADCRLKSLITLPTSFGHGLIGNALTPLMSGGDIILHPLGVSLARELGRIIDRYRIGFLSSVPAFWRMALKFSNGPSGGTLARVHVGSAPMSADLWSRIVEWSRADVLNCYGITELANWVAGASARIDGIAEGLVGRAWGGEVAVKDARGLIGRVGEGELIVKSPSAMSGYLRRPDLTARVLADGWYHTGDSGRIDERGCVTLTGRIKDEINRAGFKVQPAEIEALLETHAAISEACVFGLPDRASGEIVAAAVVPKAGKDIGIKDLRRWCEKRLRRDAIPERWFIVDKLERNARGKINREAVRQCLAEDLR